MLFKKSIEFSQFIADAIFNSMNFYDSNFEKMIVMADEFNVLNNRDKGELKDFGYALIIADLIISGSMHFNGRVTSEEMGRVVGFLYVKFLKEARLLNEKEIEKKTNNIGNLLTALEESEGNPVNGNNTENDPKFLLCSTFSKLYSGDNLKDEKVRGKGFAAFKLAKAVVKSDLIKIMLKEFRVKI